MHNSDTIMPVSFFNVRKQIGDRPILDIDEFSIVDSSCIFLSGNNGAGKTTLLKIISGLLPPDHGAISLHGETHPWSRARAIIQRDIIYLHQSPYIFDASVADNIAYGLRCRGYSRSDIQQRVDHALYWSGLEKFAARDARRLSGGEKQRVVLTRAWILKPQILLLDEPLTGLDYTARIHTLSLIERLMSDGMGIVITGHDIQASMSMATRHLHLQQGKLVACEQPDVSGQRLTEKTRLPSTWDDEWNTDLREPRALRGYL